MSHNKNLQKPIKIGSLELKNRVALGSMTRNRAVGGRVPGPDVVEYYAQRAGAGLIFTEGTIIVEHGLEWPHAPGIFSEDQIKGWSEVTKAVHAKGAKIFSQLWHVGRVAHPAMDPEGKPTLSPSGIGAKGGKFRLVEGEPGYLEKPSVLENPQDVIALFEQAAKNAIEAGFDGVEIHSANGYLPSQFLEAHSNTRTDEWGGSAQNRARFPIEAVKAAIRGVGGDSKRVGIKLSPGGGYNDMGDPEDVLTEEYSYLITELDKLDIGYIQLSRYLPHFDAEKRGTPIDVVGKFRPLIKNATVILNGMYSGDEGDKAVESGSADIVAFASSYIGNPDLAERFFEGKPLYTEMHYGTWYGPSEGKPLSDGYTDYKTAA